jgi:hypothetical protein
MLRFSLLILLLLLIFDVTEKCCAQKGITDSLKLALKNANHDTLRCNLLVALIESEEDDGVWPEYNKQLNMISEKNLRNLSSSSILFRFFKKQLAASLNNFGYLKRLQGDVSGAAKFYLQSLKIQEEIGDYVG